MSSKEDFRDHLQLEKISKRASSPAGEASRTDGAVCEILPGKFRGPCEREANYLTNVRCGGARMLRFHSLMLSKFRPSALSDTM